MKQMFKILNSNFLVFRSLIFLNKSWYLNDNWNKLDHIPLKIDIKWKKNFWRSSQQKKFGCLKDEFLTCNKNQFLIYNEVLVQILVKKLISAPKISKNLWMKMFDQPFRNLDYSMNLMKFDQIAWNCKKTKTVKKISVIETFLIGILISNIIYDQLIGVWWKIEVIILKCKR